MKSRTRNIVIFSSLAIILTLTGCKKEPLDIPDIKKYDGKYEKDELTFTRAKGTIKDPVPAGDVLEGSGDLKKMRYERETGSFGIRVKRVLREEASINRIQDEDKRKTRPKKNQDWVIVELEVWNFGKEGGALTFNDEEIGLYTSKGKKLPTYDIGLGTYYKNKNIYKGKPDNISLTTIANKKEKNILIGVKKVIDEYEVTQDGKPADEEREKKLKKERRKEIEEEKQGKKKKKSDENKNKKKFDKYLSTKNAIILKTLNPTEAQEQEKAFKEYRELQERKQADFEVDDSKDTKDEKETKKK